MNRKPRIIHCLGPKCENEALIKALWEVYEWAWDYQDAKCLLCGVTFDHDTNCPLAKVSREEAQIC